MCIANRRQRRWQAMDRIECTAMFDLESLLCMSTEHWVWIMCTDCFDDHKCSAAFAAREKKEGGNRWIVSNDSYAIEMPMHGLRSWSIAAQKSEIHVYISKEEMQEEEQRFIESKPKTNITKLATEQNKIEWKWKKKYIEIIKRHCEQPKPNHFQLCIDEASCSFIARLTHLSWIESIFFYWIIYCQT